MSDRVSFGEKHIERRLSRIGARVAEATEMSLSAKRLCEASTQILMTMQAEIAELYEELGDVLKVPEK